MSKKFINSRPETARSFRASSHAEAMAKIRSKYPGLTFITGTSSYAENRSWTGLGFTKDGVTYMLGYHLEKHRKKVKIHGNIRQSVEIGGKTQYNYKRTVTEKDYWIVRHELIKMDGNLAKFRQHKRHYEVVYWYPL
jgi:hypothetical protein